MTQYVMSKNIIGMYNIISHLSAFYPIVSPYPTPRISVSNGDFQINGNFQTQERYMTYHKFILVGGLEPWNFMTFHILGIS